MVQCKVSTPNTELLSAMLFSRNVAPGLPCDLMTVAEAVYHQQKENQTENLITKITVPDLWNRLRRSHHFGSLHCDNSPFPSR